MGSITVLPPEVADQIAAGEVVERPASVLKELVENALDAGARTISVTVDGGGVDRLVVTDDGSGMPPDDLPLAVLRHATSKIRVAEDLLGVTTHGFRGEALASVASVSRLSLRSRRPDDPEGAEIRVEGGKPSEVRPWGGPAGTTVQVEDLFFNVPARKKFLKTTATEQAQCLDAIERLALPRPDVKFVVRREGKVLREWLRRTHVGDRVREMLPDASLAEFHGQRGAIKVAAWLGPPEKARGGAAALSVYVNGRSVRDKLLLRAVATSYGNTLEAGRYPAGVLLLEVEPTGVDVNVHPQKQEVRFSDPSVVFGAVQSVLREGLDEAPWARAVATGRAVAQTRSAGGPVPTPAPPPSRIFTDWGAPPDSSTAPRATVAAMPAEPTSTRVDPVPPSPPPVLGREERDPWALTPPPSPPLALPFPKDLGSAPANVGEDSLARTEYTAFGALRFVAQVRSMFLLCEAEHGLVVLDQHAAAERVTFDRLRRTWQSRTVASQPLLIAPTLHVTAREAALVEERADEFRALGFDLTASGPQSVLVRAAPALLSRADPATLARDVIDELARRANDFSRTVDLVLATMACHGSLRAGDRVEDAEARALLTALDQTDFAGHCPHGRPIVWSIRWGELERRVGR